MNTITRYRSLGIATLFVAVAGCGNEQQQAAEPAPSFESVLNSRDARAITAWFTDDAAVLPENMRRIAGTGDILQYYTDLASSDLAYDVTATGVTADHKVAVSEGSYAVRNVKTQQEVERGKYLAVLKRTDKGWRVHRLMMNTDVQPPHTSVTVVPPGQ